MAAEFNLSKTSGRLGAYLHYFFDDHAYFRLAFSNAHWISNELVRASQPWPFQVKVWRDRGVRTILCLRGPRHGAGEYSFSQLETDACARYGVKLVIYPIFSRDVPTAEQILGARALFDGLDYPAMMHCKSGADRAGLMAVLYLHLRKGKPIAEALDQLHLRYGHVRAGSTGVLDYYFEHYLREIAPTGLSLEDWARQPDYDPAQIRQGFKAGRLGALFTDKVLRRE